MTPPIRQRDRPIGLLAPMMAGAVMLKALACVLVGATAFYWSDAGFLGTFGRIFDSLAPQLLMFGAALALWLMWLGRRTWLCWCGAGLTLIAVVASGALAMRHQTHTTPLAPETPAVIRVIWFNLYAENTTPPDQMADAILAENADLVVLGEANPILPVLDRLTAAYPYHMGCTGNICSTLVLSRTPFAPESSGMIKAARDGRMAAFRLVSPDVDNPLDVIVVHMSKPWFYGFYDVDVWHLLDQSRRARGPLLVMGDFNAAPWSRPMKRIFSETGLMSQPHPVATWPGAAGPMGVAIDQMLGRGSVTFSDLSAWGGDLGSNHRGLVAQIAWGQK